MKRVIFLTDYGYTDAFAGICRAIVTEAAPGVEVVDLTHGVPLGDVRRGAFVLESAVDHTGPALFLAVVDPGVGGDRRAVALRAGEKIFVGPDNGLLLEAAERAGGVAEAVEISSGPFVSATRSHTFHGRDVFAPVAAALARGEALDAAGEPLEPSDLVRLDLPSSSIGESEVETHVLVEDGFGNLSLGVRVGGTARLPFGPGDAVWTTPITFVASANCAVYCGARIDFVDIDPRTYTMCPERPIMPLMARIVVVLPAPLAPSRPVMAPLAAVKSTPATAATTRRWRPRPVVKVLNS
jgi:S-adenosylmethionine hydrolase